MIEVFKNPLGKAIEVDGCDEPLLNGHAIASLYTYEAYSGNVVALKAIVDMSLLSGESISLIKELIKKMMDLDESAIRQLQTLVADGFQIQINNELGLNQ
jgi:hypothetical protein